MSTQSRIDAESHKDPATLEREIDQQRESITHLVNALESKLSPGQLLDQALSYTKGHGGEFAANLGQTVKANPVPTLLTTVGLAWMMMGQRQPSTSSTGHGVDLHGAAESAKSAMAGMKDKANDARHSASDMTDKANRMQHDVRDKLSATGQQIGDSSRQAADSLRRQGERAQAGFQNLLHEQPLVLGALGIAIGAMLGGALPRTTQEDQLMGDKSDQLTEKAKQKAKEGYQKAANAGEDMAHEVNERMRSQGSDSSRTGTTPGLHS